MNDVRGMATALAIIAGTIMLVLFWMNEERGQIVMGTHAELTEESKSD